MDRKVRWERGLAIMDSRVGTVVGIYTGCGRIWVSDKGSGKTDRSGLDRDQVYSQGTGHCVDR